MVIHKYNLSIEKSNLIQKYPSFENRDGNLHPRFKDFLGDYLAIAIGEISIFNSREDARQFIGMHAGMTQKEMMVPLIVVEKK